MSSIRWQCQPFLELSTLELYKILQLRNEVFVLEQNCIYQDCDGKDIACWHVCGWVDNELISYCRILPPGLSYPGAASIGRVLTAPHQRKKRAGKQLIAYSIENLYRLFGDIQITISAQLYLKRFYESFHFIQNSGIYLEDNIEHIQMIRAAEAANMQ